METVSSSDHLRLLTQRLSVAVQTALRRRDNSLQQIYYQTLSNSNTPTSNQTVTIAVSVKFTEAKAA